MSAYFIAGAGTDIGKTFTTCALIYAAKYQQKPVQAYKPVITGYVPHDKQSDTELLIDALEGGSVEEISPWRYSMPLSPDMAAQNEGHTIELNALSEWTQQVKQQSGLTLIETIGGVMVPLNAQTTTRDWMQAAACPLILVMGTYVGAISHGLTAIEAVQSLNIPIAALIVNQTPQGADLNATRDSVAKHVRNIPFIIAQRRVASAKDATALHTLLEHLS